MPRLPGIRSQIAARGARAAGITPGTRATSTDAFGGATARGLGAFAEGMSQLGTGVGVFLEKRQNELVTNRIAQSDFTDEELALRNEVGPDAAGYKDAALARHSEWVEEQAESIEDDDTRTEFKRRMMLEQRSLSSRSSQYEFTTAATNSKNEADNSLTSLQNKIRLDPISFDRYVQQGSDVLDTRTDVPKALIAGMKKTWLQNSAFQRFEGMLDRAKSIHDLDQVENDLRNVAGERDWTETLGTAQLDNLLGTVSKAKSSFNTKMDANARAALETISERAKDITTLIPAAELQAVADAVSKSQNPVTISKMARVIRDQRLIKENQGLTVKQMEAKRATTDYAKLPPVLDSAVARASQMYGISPGFLASTIEREYGEQLKPGADGSINYGIGNLAGTSKALGVMQFVPKTFLDTMRMGGVAERLGIDLSNMSETEILALRADPVVATIAGAAFAAQNKKFLEISLGRKVSDPELYMAHFMGASGASKFLKATRANPEAIAADMFPAYAKANRSVYYSGKGTSNPKTMREVHAEMSRMHAGGTTAVAYGDKQLQTKIIDDTKKQLADDMMSYAGSTGTFAISDLEGDGAYAARGEQALSVASYFNIPQPDMKPFTKSDVEDLTKRMKEGTTEDVLAVLADVQSMGDDVYPAALAQLDTDNGVYALAGGLQAATDNSEVATAIINGSKRMDENPAIRDMVGASREAVNSAFLDATGGSLLGANPKQRQNIMDAALAHYVETVAATGNTSFDSDKFTNSVNAVLGGKGEEPKLALVNDKTTILPKDVTGDEMESAIDHMLPKDWIEMSVTGHAPAYADGTLANVEDLALEATMHAIGGEQYIVKMNDGTTMVTRDVDSSGALKPFIFAPTKKAVDKVNATYEADLAVRKLAYKELTPRELVPVADVLRSHGMDTAADIVTGLLDSAIGDGEGSEGWVADASELWKEEVIPALNDIFEVDQNPTADLQSPGRVVTDPASRTDALLKATENGVLTEQEIEALITEYGISAEDLAELAADLAGGN